MATSTPWGTSQTSTELARGIRVYSTASHGGIHLSTSKQKMVPDNIKNFLDSKEWWEEDCDWAVPYVLFAEDIKLTGKDKYFEEHLKAAKETLRQYHPEMMEREEE